jgi:heat shock protein 1/8
MPPKRQNKGSKQGSKAPSKAASKAPSAAPSGTATPRVVEHAPALLGLNFGQSFSSVAIIDKVRFPSLSSSS